jgi:hypothetical protein
MIHCNLDPYTKVLSIGIRHEITLDVENTVTKRDGKMHLDPFEPD